jgi:hypothetical protein
MISAYRFKGQVVLQVESGSGFEAALLSSTRDYGIQLKPVPTAPAGFSRYALSKPEEGRFGAHLRVVFRRWPRRLVENRVRAELRRMDGALFCCRSTARQVHLTAPHNDVARVRCGLHAGTFGWVSPSCSEA